MGISKIKKRDGTIVMFKKSKIAAAIEKTMLAVGEDVPGLPEELAEKVYSEVLESQVEIPSVEQIQDIVENVLMNEGLSKMAKAYILYRQKRTELRKLKKNILGRMDDSKLSVNGLLIAKNRYLHKEAGVIKESPKDMFRRIAKKIASIEKDREKYEQEFFDIMSTLKFVPGGRILANVGNSNMLYSSYVLPIKDSMKGIFKALYEKALVQRHGGGTGFSFSRLRPKGAILTTTGGVASGPIEFIKLFDHASELTVQSGNRKAANMGSLNVEHPDIIQFITMKERNEVKNFNISVEITDKFMEAVKEKLTYELKDPSTGRVIDSVDSNNLFHLIVTMAWKTGDPGILFIDRINKHNSLIRVGKIETTDPCGDQLLLPHEAGNIGAINLSRFTRNKRIQWKEMTEVTRLSVRFLDNVVDVSRFPTKKIEKVTKETRRLGLGVMGFADMLYKLRVPYDSEKGIEIGEKVMKHIKEVAYDESRRLAEEKGVFPLWEKSTHKIKMRNSSLIAISPTGARSILVDASAGIEPNFGLGYIRKVLGNTEILHINRVLEDVLKEYEIDSEDVIREIINSNSLQNINLPEELKRVFVTAYQIKPEWHIEMQAAFQKHVDNAISKTINFPKKATIEDVKKAFLMAYSYGCKGLTVYREGSLNEEVIKLGNAE